MLENSPRAPSGNRDYHAEMDLIRNSKRFKYWSKLPDDTEVGRPLTPLWCRSRVPFGYCAGTMFPDGVNIPEEHRDGVGGYDVPYGDDIAQGRPWACCYSSASSSPASSSRRTFCGSNWIQSRSTCPSSVSSERAATMGAFSSNPRSLR